MVGLLGDAGAHVDCMNRRKLQAAVTGVDEYVAPTRGLSRICSLKFRRWNNFLVKRTWITSLESIEPHVMNEFCVNKSISMIMTKILIYLIKDKGFSHLTDIGEKQLCLDN